MKQITPKELNHSPNEILLVFQYDNGPELFLVSNYSYLNKTLAGTVMGDMIGYNEDTLNPYLLEIDSLIYIKTFPINKCNIFKLDENEYAHFL